MKRRNVELAKMRRPIKRNKITEGFYGSTLLYLKFLILWILVILADFILEFRFEFLWPFYLLIRSVYDSFKYQGLAFSIFFVLIALTSDMLCFFFIPVHWLFFAASTYVWVQYVWQTDKGICAPTVVLWILFVYLEAAIRLRDVKHLPGHLDLCRPFAAHCIGYPVVTLGFGFKSYIGFRMRQRKQQQVAKENEFYMQLMQQALPAETAPPEPLAAATMQAAPSSDSNANKLASSDKNANHSVSEKVTSSAAPNVQNNNKIQSNSHSSKQERNGHIPNGTLANGISHHGSSKSHRRGTAADRSKDHSGDQNERNYEKQKVNHSHSNGSAIEPLDDSASCVHEVEPRQTSRRKEKREQEKDREAQEYLQRLEVETKKLRTDLQSSRASEQELRIQVASLTTSEKGTKGELSMLQRQIDDLQERLQNATSLKNSDRQTINSLERRLVDERRLRSQTEQQLSQERKSRKQEEARLAQIPEQQTLNSLERRLVDERWLRSQAKQQLSQERKSRKQGEARLGQVAAQQSSRTECTEACKSRRRELENELESCRLSQRWAEEKNKNVELENQALKEQMRDTELLIGALNSAQEKNSDLENSLSAETRIKLDLFCALGEAKRQLEISMSMNRAHEKEIEELKSKIAQVLAVMPNDTFGAHSSPSSGATVSRVRLAESPQSSLSKLDPNATAYTPKGSLITSTEA